MRIFRRYATLSFLVLSLLLVQHVYCHAKRQQPDTPETPQLHLSPLEWGDINFIHTTDSHGWLEGHLLDPSYNGDIGDVYSFIVRMKQKARLWKRDLLVVDTGDTHDGNGLSDITNPKGAVTQPLLTHIPYDILSIGNHELYSNDITVDTVKNFVPHWKGRYLAANVYLVDSHSNKRVQIGEKYTYFEAEFGTRVLAFGFLFNFKNNGNQSFVREVQDEIADPWFLDALKSHNPDVIVLIGHIGLRFQEFQVVIDAIRKQDPYIPIAVLGGHTHIRDFVVYDERAAGIESGRYLETIGFFSVDGIAASRKWREDKLRVQEPSQSLSSPPKITFHRRYLDQNRKTYKFHALGDKTHAQFDTRIGKRMTRKVTKLRKQLKISRRIGCAPQHYTISAAPVNGSDSIYHLIATEVFPKVVRDPSRTNPAYMMMNTGSQRYDIYKGDFTLDNIYQVSPFPDSFQFIADVPYSVAIQILPRLSDGDSSNRKKRSIYPLNGQGMSMHSHTFAARGMENALLVPGYTTTDDLGTDGDDTHHARIPLYTIEDYFGTELPANATPDTLIDVVFLDFSAAQTLSIVQQLTGRNWTVQNYQPAITTAIMWKIYAETFWTGTCG